MIELVFKETMFNETTVLILRDGEQVFSCSSEEWYSLFPDEVHAFVDSATSPWCVRCGFPHTNRRHLRPHGPKTYLEWLLGDRS